jgi:BASS family bile acid:Na+ symporter
MAEILLSIGSIAILGFIVTSMIVMGLNVTIRDLLAPMKDRRLILAAIVANFILVPVLAFIIIFIIPVSREIAAGLILVSLAAGAPSTPKVAELTQGNIAYAVAVTILMTVLTIFLMPIVLPYLLGGITMDPSRIALNLVVLMLIPLLIGMGMRYRSDSMAKKALPVLFWISNGCIGIVFLTFGLLLLSRLGTLFGGDQGLLMLVIAFVFTLGSLAIGYALGGSSSETRRVLAFGTGFRNITAALVVITATFQDPGNDVLIMVLIVTLVSVIIVSAIVGLTLKKSIDEGRQLGYSNE